MSEAEVGGIAGAGDGHLNRLSLKNKVGAKKVRLGSVVGWTFAWMIGVLSLGPVLYVILQATGMLIGDSGFGALITSVVIGSWFGVTVAAWYGKRWLPGHNWVLRWIAFIGLGAASMVLAFVGAMVFGMMFTPLLLLENPAWGLVIIAALGMGLSFLGLLGLRFRFSSYFVSYTGILAIVLLFVASVDWMLTPPRDYLSNWASGELFSQFFVGPAMVLALPLLLTGGMLAPLFYAQWGGLARNGTLIWSPKHAARYYGSLLLFTFGTQALMGASTFLVARFVVG